MTERRPHWDDDLINAVFRIMDDYAAEVWRREWDHGTPTFDIIAAVEDWHERKGEENLPLLMAMMNAESTKFRRRAEQAEAAIQRVRELHHPIPGFNDSLWCGAHCESTADGDPTHYPCATIRALDGER